MWGRAGLNENTGGRSLLVSLPQLLHPGDRNERSSFVITNYFMISNPLFKFFLWLLAKNPNTSLIYCIHLWVLELKVGRPACQTSTLLLNCIHTSGMMLTLFRTPSA